MVATWRNLSPKEKAVVAAAINGVGPHIEVSYLQGSWLLMLSSYDVGVSI